MATIYFADDEKEIREIVSIFLKNNVPLKDFYFFHFPRVFISQIPNILS